MDTIIESIFKVIPYENRSYSKRYMRYHWVRVSGSNALYFKNLEETEEYIHEEAQFYEKCQFNSIYAYVVLEIPLRTEVNIMVSDEYMTMRIYLQDGTLWGKNTYSNFIPHSCASQFTMFWRAKNAFWGREPGEIRFKPGDIVEILGCHGNDYWGNESVDLAIVVGTPETVEHVAERKKEYLATHDGFDVTDVGMAYEFDASHDTYEVIPYAGRAYFDYPDHAPTICVFPPSRPVHPRRQKILRELFNSFSKK